MSSFSVYWTRLHGAVYKIGKGIDCWVKCLFVFYIGVCKSFNRDAYTEPPVVRGKEWVQFYKGRSIHHAHNVRKHPYLDHDRRCEPCTQDEIKTKNIYIGCCLFPQTLSPKRFYSSRNMFRIWSQAWYPNRYYGQSTDVETESQWQRYREHGKRWKPNVSAPELLLVLLHCQALFVLFVSTRKYNMGCLANY